MYIDFHIHAFADSIAEKAVSNLEKTAGIKGYTNGRIDETINRLKEWGVDKAVLLPIATKPTQQITINNWAKAIMDTHDRIISFGTVHPDSDTVFEELDRIKSMGLKGVKFHPDYQNFFISEEKMLPIYQKCSDVGLPVIFHGGYDPYSPDVMHAPPKETARIVEMFPELTIVIAHMGGIGVWDDAEKYLVGKNVYLDTAYTADFMPKEQALRIIRNHGADRILFASDLPWHRPTDEMEFYNSMNLTDEEKELIFHKNAEKLLGI